MSPYKDHSYLRSKSQVSKIAVTLTITVVGAALAFTLGLALRSRFSGGTAEAQSQAQAPASDPAITASATSPTPNPAVAAGLLTQTVNGIEFTATNFRKEEDQLKADICFVLQDSSDWIVWKASLKYMQDGQEAELSDFGGMPIELREFPVNGQQKVVTFQEAGKKTVHWEPATAGQMGLRCDTLSFEVPAQADLSNFEITIHSIGAYPDEGKTCDYYMNRVQNALDVRKTGIKLQCTEEAGVQDAKVISKPVSMSQEEAEQIAFSDEFFTLKGPWIFTGSLK